MAILLVTVFLLLLYAFLIFFYYHHWQRLSDYIPREIKPEIPVSVVIAARNEARNLPGLLKSLEAQTYPAHLIEVIVVDDFSTDDTAQLLEPFRNRVRVLQPDTAAGNSSKKKAIATGIARASHELIVITDADCLPGRRWLETLVCFQQERQASFIAAPVRFTVNKDLLQVFQALDFLTLQGITAASVSARFHSMCNGANLAYKKSSFIAVNGFEGIDQVASGDDMLLMHKISRQEPGAVYYLKSREAIMDTRPMQSWKELLMQRRRWASKTAHYDDKKILMVLVFVYLFNCWFLVTLISFILTGSWFPFFLFLLVKTIIEWPFVASVATFYGQQRLMRWFPLLQPVHMVFIVFAGLLSQLGRYEWKGRKTN